MNYNDAFQILSIRTQKKIGHNTWLHRIDDETLAIRYHSTDVVLLHKCGDFTLETGGWWTSTTKLRLNRYTPCTVYSDQGEWMVSGGGCTVEYRDGMRVDWLGRDLDHLSEEAC